MLWGFWYPALRSDQVRGRKLARAMLLESHVGCSDAGDHQLNAVLELKVGDAAHVDHIKITGEGAGALHVSTLIAAVGAHARFNEFLFTIGGGIVRNQAFVRSMMAIIFPFSSNEIASFWLP